MMGHYLYLTKTNTSYPKIVIISSLSGALSPSMNDIRISKFYIVTIIPQKMKQFGFTMHLCVKKMFM